MEQSHLFLSSLISTDSKRKQKPIVKGSLENGDTETVTHQTQERGCLTRIFYKQKRTVAHCPRSPPVRPPLGAPAPHALQRLRRPAQPRMPRAPPRGTSGLRRGAEWVPRAVQGASPSRSVRGLPYILLYFVPFFSLVSLSPDSQALLLPSLEPVSPPSWGPGGAPPGPALQGG